MAVIERFYGCIDKKALCFEQNEVALRLKCGRGYTNELIENCKQLLLDSTECKYSGALLEININGNIIDFGDFAVESKDLSKNLKNSNLCFVFCVTLGLKTDYFLNKLSVASMAEHYITDALASALAEYSADVAEKAIKGNYECCKRFSCGYGDFGLHYQKSILEIIDAHKRLGVSLSKSHLMTPQKTITAVMGVK